MKEKERERARARAGEGGKTMRKKGNYELE